MTRVHISDELAAEAQEVMKRCMQGTLDVAEGKGSGIILGTRCNAAKNILTLYDTQQRYQLKPQTPAEFERHARLHTPTSAKKLANLTPDELLEMQQKLVGESFKQRKADPPDA